MTTLRTARPDDIETLLRYAQDRGRESRLPRAAAPRPTDPLVDPATSLWRRLAVTHAARRLPAGRHAEAAAAGLQDSAPRAGQLALHARVEGIDPGGWEHPDLLQIWFRGADYLIPKTDHALFSRGAMPRDPSVAVALERLADQVEQHLNAGVPGGEIRRRLEGLPIRATSVTGRVCIRWDARTVELIAVEPPEVGDEGARLRLAERFVHCYGPVTSDQLAKWAGTSRADAAETWQQLDDLVPVATPRGRAWMFERDLAHATRMSRPLGVRLLPQGDPALYLDPPAPRATPALSHKVTARVANGLTGRIILDGEVVGSWGRRDGTVTLFVWVAVADHARSDIEADAKAVAAAVGKQPRIVWLEQGATS